jgi:hypothetical protein
MRANGKITGPMARVNSSMWMAIYTKAIGSMTKLTDSESIFMLMGQGMRVIGRMICSMARERRLGQMAQFMKASISRARSTDSDCTAGMTAPDMRESGMKTK